MRSVVSAFAVSLLVACNTGPSSAPEPAKPTAKAPTAPSAASPSPNDGALHLGAPIEAATQKVALADVAKSPDAYVGKTFTTTGTVTAVCQHMGCWMEIKDDAGEAHIKMAGHAFFVPKTAAGHKARVLATLVKNPADEACGEEADGKMAAQGGAASGAHPSHAKGKGCRAEAEAQLGRPLAKLELVAEGVELM